MKEYKIKIIDGNPNWNLITELCIDNPYLDTPSSISAKAQICCNSDRFFVHLSTKEENYLREENGPLGLPYLDSCLEFFFSPIEDDNRYFNIEFNSNACVFLGFASKVEDIVRQIPKDGILDILNPVVNTYNNSWEIFYEIPFEFIRRYFPQFDVFDGKKIRANCFKCSDNSNPPHYLSWNLVKGEPFTFHKTECFGVMIFEK